MGMCRWEKIWYRLVKKLMLKEKNNDDFTSLPKYL